MVGERGSNTDGERARRAQRLERRARQQIAVERFELTAARDPDVTCAEPFAQLGEGAELVSRAIDPVLGHHERPPATRNEPERRRRRKLAFAGGVKTADHLECREQTSDRTRALEHERLKELRPELTHGPVLCDQLGGVVDRFVWGERLSLDDGPLELLPVDLLPDHLHGVVA